MAASAASFSRSWLLLAAIFLAGAAGVLARFFLHEGGLLLLSGLFRLSVSGADMLSTLAINTLGVLAMAASSHLLSMAPERIRLMVNTGFFGGLTTFSAVILFSLNPLSWLPGWPPLLAWGLYLLLSLFCAWIAAMAGYAAGARIVSRTRMPAPTSPVEASGPSEDDS